MESAAEYEEVARGAFLDMEGASDVTSFEELTQTPLSSPFVGDLHHSGKH
jgi:hypothetical protein